MSSLGYVYYLDSARNLQVGSYTRATGGGTGVDLDFVHKSELAAVEKKIGDLEHLATDDKSSVMAAVNEVAGY